MSSVYKSDPRFAKAARLAADVSYLSVPKAMRAEGFTEEEVSNASYCRQVRRMAARVPKVIAKKTSVDNISPLTPDEAGANSDSKKKSGRLSKKRKKLPGVQIIRKTTKQSQIIRQNEKKEGINKSVAFKKCTAWYAVEKPKKGGMSARMVVDSVNKEYETNISVRTVQHYVKNHRLDMSPQKTGPRPGLMPKESFETLLDAFQSFVQINQINCQPNKNRLTKLNRCVHKAVGFKSYSESRSLVNQLRSRGGVDLSAQCIPSCEERRVRWTTYDNIKLWFDSWKRTLLEYRFMFFRDGEFVIPDSQLRRIINLDESNLSLDGSTETRGGRGGAALWDTSLPMIGQPVNKSNVSLTLITGSSAFGEPLPPHFQFQTKAKTTENMNLRTETIRFMKNIHAAFGHRDSNNEYLERSWPVTLGMNEKGGMDDAEFYKYISNSIRALFPDVGDRDGRRVIVKIDSGPGRTNMELLCRLRIIGILLYPCVPNTTAVTQETDQSYGYFKTIYRTNLHKLSTDRLERDLPGPSLRLIGLLVFGGTDPETGCIYQDAFADAFSNEKCLSAWKKIGAAPFTMACLSNTLVRRSVGGLNEGYDEIQARNTLACNLLTTKGFDGNALKGTIIQKAPKAGVTRPHSLARLELLARAKSHGDKFFATGGEHATSDDAFMAMELVDRRKKVKALEKLKSERLAMEDIETKAFAIIETEKTPAQMKKDELKILLLFYGYAKSTINGKQGRIPSVKALRNIYAHERKNNNQPMQFQKWTAEDEAKLKQLKDISSMTLMDTAVGRQKQNLRIETREMYRNMSQEEKDDLKKELNTIDEDLANATETADV